MATVEVLRPEPAPPTKYVLTLSLEEARELFTVLDGEFGTRIDELRRVNQRVYDVLDALDTVLLFEDE